MIFEVICIFALHYVHDLFYKGYTYAYKVHEKARVCST